MVHVEGDDAVLDGLHEHGEGLAARAHHVHGLAHRQLVGVGNLVHRHLLHHLIVALAIGLGGRDVHGLLLAHGHILHGGVEAGDHLAGHAGELDGLAAVHGRIELRAVIQRAGVVHLDLLAFVAHR